MKNQPEAEAHPADRLERLHKRLESWSVRLRAAGLDGLVGAVLDAAGPLAPLGAQALWEAQPALRLLVASDDIDGLPRLLASRQRINWLRREFTRPRPVETPIAPMRSSQAIFCC